jgi:hypothetical protein
MSFKSRKIVQNASISLKMFQKSLTSIKKSLHSTKNIFKKPQGSQSLKNPRILKKKASYSLEESLKCHAFLKKSLTFSKKKPRGNCQNGQSVPGL